MITAADRFVVRAKSPRFSCEIAAFTFSERQHALTLIHLLRRRYRRLVFTLEAMGDQ